MSFNLKTYSKFYYGIEIVDGQNVIDFYDGVSNKSAIINVGGYSLQGLATEVATQMNKVTQNNGFTVIVNRNNRYFTIKTVDNTNFSLLFLTGTNNILSPYAVLGFPKLDFTGSFQYTSTASIGKVYSPQFLLQNYVDADLTSSPVEAVVNRSTSGNKYEVVRFGTNKIYRFELAYTTNVELIQANYIRNNPTGIEDLVDFMEFCTRKFPLEFMKDEADSSQYDTVVLESTPQSQDGVSYEISPDYGQNLPEFYTLGGPLSFRRLLT
jgi:hypothetical protein